MKKLQYPTSLLALAIASAHLTAPLQASANSFVLEEIVVTAQKREESVDDVPIALSAFSDSFIKETKINDAKQLVRFTPGLAGESKDSFVDSLSVRGISTNAFGIGGDTSLGMYKDGVYIGRNGTAVSSFYDIDRVEVLKGPQGLLFGRNAASGAIHTITAKPQMDVTEGYIRLGAGERGRMQTEFAYNQPLAEGWAMRVAGMHSEEDGYVENLFNDDDLIEHNRDAIRLALKHEADWGDVTISTEYEDREQSGTIYIAQDANGNPITGDKRKANTDWEDKDEGEVGSVTITANIDLDDNMTLTSITGYNTHNWTYQEDFDGSPLPVAGYTQEQDGEYYSQELRLNVDQSDTLKWYVGASIYQEKVSALLSNQTGDLAPLYGSPVPVLLFETNEAKGDYSGWALYGDMTYQLTDNMDISFGLRYTYDKKEMELDIQGQGLLWSTATPVPVEDKEDWDDLSPRVTLRYFTEDEWLIFASITEGYKSGGFATDQLATATSLQSFDPESIRSYEIGTKGELADGKVKFGLSAYYYDYEDLQQTITELGTIRVENIGEAEGYGIELDLRAALNDNWSIFLGAAWSETEVDGLTIDACDAASTVGAASVSCNGNSLPYNPEWTASGGINANYPVDGGEVFATLDFSWQSTFDADITNQKLTEIDDAGFVNLRAGWNSDQDWSVTFYVENIFDEESFDSRKNIPDPDLSLSFYTGPSTPRTAGVDFTYNFSM